MQRAKEIGIKGRSTMSKPQLIKATARPLIHPGWNTWTGTRCTVYGSAEEAAAD